MSEVDLSPFYQDHISNMCQDKKHINFFQKIQDGYFNKNLSRYKFKQLFNTIEEIYTELNQLKEKLEIEDYAKYSLDIDLLKQDFLEKRHKSVEAVFPELDLNKLKELYDNPPTKLKSPVSQYKCVYDKVVVRKYIIAIMQMIFNKMDLVVVFAGGEGTGKTTASTQDAYLCYYILSEIGVINYSYSLPRIMNSTLKSMIDSMNKYSREPFSIHILDEGNELNRKNWGNPLVQTFVQKLRRERSHLRIIFINLPQLGELTTDLTLARVNFVFQMSMKANIKTKLVDKGLTSFIIIPRSDKIYSYHNQVELTNSFIRDHLGVILDDKKKYYKKLPDYLVVKKFTRNGVWTFRESEYEKMKKEANESFGTYGLSLSQSEIWYLSEYLDLKKMGVKTNTKAYHILRHLKNKKLAPMTKDRDKFNNLDETEFEDD